jgi:hypothetical protein
MRLDQHGVRLRLKVWDSVTEIGFAIRAVPFEDRERLREGCAVLFMMKDQLNIGRVVPAE